MLFDLKTCEKETMIAGFERGELHESFGRSNTHRCGEREPLLPFIALSDTIPGSKSEPKRRIVYGYTLTLLSALAFSVSSFLVHVAETRFATPFMWAMILRGIVQTVLSLYYLAVSPEFRSALPSLTSAQLGCVLVRSIAGTLSIAALYAAVQFSEVGTSVAIYSSSPAISVLLATIILREKVTRSHAAAAVAAAIGAILVGLSSGTVSTQALLKNHASVDLGVELNHSLGAGLAALAATLAAVSLVALRKLSISTHFMVAVLAFGVTTLCCSVLFWLFNPSIISGWTNFGILAAVVAAVIAFAGQCCVSGALRDCPVTPATVLLNMEVPVSFLMGLIFLGEQPNLSQICGSLVIFLSIIFMSLRP